jgi:hypothetical protein
MKIVATMDNNKVLCTVTADEIARLHGYKTTYDKGWNPDRNMAIGNEIELIKAFESLDTLRSLDKDQITRVNSEIKRLQQSLTNVVEAHQKLMLLDVIKNSDKAA